MSRNLSMTFILIIIALVQIASASPTAKILSMSGEVKLRRGLDENWQPAASGMLLELLDTILTMEGNVVLEMEEGITFRLGSNSIIDIGDLRKITKREMFLYLMSEKVDKIKPRNQKTPLRVGNVSVVHGELKAESSDNGGDQHSQMWIKEFNGAKALYDQEFYPNTIVKLYKIQNKYPDINDCGEIHYYLGKTFEIINEPGQAVDAYQIIIERHEDCNSSDCKRRIEEAQHAIKRLTK
jgi:hypothetical protein